MVLHDERLEIINFFKKNKVDFSRLVWYHCTSEYPCPFDRLYLREISILKELVPVKSFVGFSNHGYGIAADIAACVLGATWIERHFVDDRALRHTDAAVSLEPGGFRKLIRDLDAVRDAMQYKLDMSDEEKEQRCKLKTR